MGLLYHGWLWLARRWDMWPVERVGDFRLALVCLLVLIVVRSFLSA